ncbi:MAG: metal-dependent hydrolase [Proteobacteria bacterium]|nr:metal-dependent hydrolase [Burkholderiales bacterium]
MIVGAAAGALPDIDFVLSYISPIAYLTGHRGLTHSVLLLPIWAGLLAWLGARLARQRTYLRPFFWISAAGIGSHIVGDLITSFGTMVLEPVSSRRFAWSTTFIIDLWFTGILVAGLAATLAFRRRRLPAMLSLAVLGAYVGLSAVQQQRAIDVGLARAQANGWSDATVTVVPRPVSPFNWMVLVEYGEGYEVAQVNLNRRERLVADANAGIIRRLDAAYLPVAEANWSVATRFGLDDDARELAQAVWDHPEFAQMRWFYALPALYAIKRTPGEQCVWFQDLRFVVPGRAQVPFRYGMCRASVTAPWQRLELAGDDDERRPI